MTSSIRMMNIPMPPEPAGKERRAVQEPAATALQPEQLRPPTVGLGKHRFIKDTGRTESGYWVLADEPPLARNTEMDSIYVPVGRRQVDLEAVAELAKSIARVGLLEPIRLRYNEVYNDPDEGEIHGALTLIAGAHRLEACRSLGWTGIPAVVLHDLTDRQARMMEITENLHRSDLTELERREQVGEWARLSEQEPASGIPRPVGAVFGGRGNTGGIRAAARELNMPEVEVRRSAKIDAISAEAKSVAKETGLDDNRSALEIAASKPKEEQADTLRAIKAAGTVAAFKAAANSARPPREHMRGSRVGSLSELIVAYFDEDPSRRETWNIDDVNAQAATGQDLLSAMFFEGSRTKRSTEVDVLTPAKKLLRALEEDRGEAVERLRAILKPLVE